MLNDSITILLFIYSKESLKAPLGKQLFEKYYNHKILPPSRRRRREYQISDDKQKESGICLKVT